MIFSASASALSAANAQRDQIAERSINSHGGTRK
jgi:hypothetical protein